MTVRMMDVSNFNNGQVVWLIVKVMMIKSITVQKVIYILCTKASQRKVHKNNDPSLSLIRCKSLPTLIYHILLNRLR